MVLDTAINLPTVIALFVSIVSVVAWLLRMEGRVNSSVKEQQFHEYQLAAAEKYMTQAAFGEIKRELVSEINRMEGRLEAQIERIGNRPAPARRTTGQS